MLRIEEGLDTSLFSSENSRLNGYVQHHRLVVPSIAAYDIHSQEAKESTLAERYTKVVSGLQRSATLCFELDDLEYAAMSDDWQSTKAFTGINKDTVGSWRYKRDPNDGHSHYDSYAIWTAKRNLVEINEDVSLRERYTIATPKTASEDEIAAIIENDEAKKDFLIATATVYVLNMTVEKPQADLYVPAHGDSEWKKYPILAAHLDENL